MATTGVPAFRVEFDGEWADVAVTGLSDMVAFERHFGIPATALEPEEVPVLAADGSVVLNEDGTPKVELVGNLNLEWMVFLFWRGLRKSGVIGKDVEFDDDFIDRITDVEVPDAEEVADGQDPSDPDLLSD